MTREVVHRRGPGPSAAVPQGGGVPAMVVSGSDDAWLLPDDPFLNAGCTVMRAGGLAEASRLCAHSPPRLVFLPLSVAGEPSLPQLKSCLLHRPAPVVVVIATNDQINAAAEAMRAGAFDCLFKPFSPFRLAKTIESAMKSIPRPAPPTPAVDSLAGAQTRGARGAVPAAGGDSKATGPGGLIGASPAMRAVFDKVEAVAPTPAPAFLTGEVGTGKSTLARLIHDRSPRAEKPFVTLDCATLTTARFEAEVFGPDGAARRADGGTLYLDEVCELDPAVQPRILHLIETGLPEGGHGDVADRVDLRLIAATRHDPRVAVREGRLRADLYYRLHVAPIDLAPLRARVGDISLIARLKLRQFSEIEGRGFTGFSDAALDLLTAYSWPGNVRELLNVIWTAVLMHEGPLVTPEQLPDDVRLGSTEPSAEPYAADLPAAPGTEALVGRTLAEIERDVIEATIRAEGGSVPRAARVLDVSPSTLYRKREAWTKGGNT